MSEAVKENMAVHPVGIVTAYGVTQPLHRHNPPEKQRPCMFLCVYRIKLLTASHPFRKTAQNFSSK